MNYQGRQVDPIAVWGDYVSFPPNMRVDENDEFLPLLVCPNPDHHTEKRHFQINVQKPLVHCFANCGISGTYEHAIGLIEGIKPRESRKRILKHSRVGSGVKIRKRSAGSATVISPSDLEYDRYIPAFGTDYLSARSISAESIAQWEIGWNPDERRIVIPVKDTKNRVRLLCQRAVREKDHPKYLYTEGVEKERFLYGGCAIDTGMIRSFGVVLVEGAIDTIIMRQHGFHTTFGILGSSLSEFQARQIQNMRPARVICMFDADGSGISATISAIKLLPRTPIRVCRYPKGISDPGATTKDQAERMVRRAVSKRDFIQIVQSHGITIRSSNHRKGRDFSFG